MNRAVLFDCDGVLVDSENGLSKISSYILNTYYDIPAKPSDFLPFIGTGEDSYIGGVVNKYEGEFVPSMKQKIYDEYIKSARDYIAPMKGAKDLIFQLRSEGIKVAIVSSADLPKVMANIYILNMNIEDFDAVITGNNVVRKKPDPQIYLFAANKCNVDPVNCIVVEDATSGVIAGKDAGMKVIGFTSSVTAKTLMEVGAYTTVDNMEKLYEVLNENW